MWKIVWHCTNILLDLAESGCSRDMLSRFLHRLMNRNFVCIRWIMAFQNHARLMQISEIIIFLIEQSCAVDAGSKAGFISRRLNGSCSSNRNCHRWFEVASYIVGICLNYTPLANRRRIGKETINHWNFLTLKSRPAVMSSATRRLFYHQNHCSSKWLPYKCMDTSNYVEAISTSNYVEAISK